MKFTPTLLPGVIVIDLEPRADERGFFARTFCGDELGRAGISFSVVQENVSYNHRRGTLRGLHLQRDPHGEPKLVRCTRGAIWDVAVDVRSDSPTRGRWFGVEIDADNRRALFIPSGFAHGFITLADASEVLYLMGAPYVAEAASGFRYDDPAFGIEWPLLPTVIAEKDRSFAAFTP
jgi:dTDP-4-dehydrorhamnose 3,5-epimerase